MNTIRRSSVEIVLKFLFLIGLIRLGYLTLYYTSPFPGGIPPPPARGIIQSFDNVVLAESQTAWNVYLNTRKIISSNVINELKIILNISPEILNTLQDKPGVHLLKRYIDNKTAEKLRNLNVKSILLEAVNERIYNEGSTLAHVIGFTGTDGNGLTGLELNLNSLLASHHEESNKINVVLTINLKIQKETEKELSNAVRENNAQSGIVIVQKTHSSEIITFAVYPSYNPAQYEKLHPVQLINPAVSHLFEPGSIFKAFISALLLERGLIKINKPYYNCTGSIILTNGEVIRCAKAHGRVSLADIIKFSCNSGMIQAAEKLAAQDIYDFLVNLNFGEKTGIILPGEEKGILRKPADWGVRTKAVITIGHGVAVTPVQLITAFSALMNGGVYINPSMVHHIMKCDQTAGRTNFIKQNFVRKVIEKNTSESLRTLLTYGTVQGSTGYRARETGFVSAGKTSTAQKPNLEIGGYYTNRFNAMFIGVFPPEDPEFTILVILTSPQENYYGGTSAAPVYASLLPIIAKEFNLVHSPKTIYLKNEIMKSYFSGKEKTVEKNIIPDFTGLSLRDALKKYSQFKKINNLEKHTYPVKIAGNGYVFSQEPQAGEIMKNETEIKLILKMP